MRTLQKISELVISLSAASSAAFTVSVILLLAMRIMLPICSQEIVGACFRPLNVQRWLLLAMLQIGHAIFPHASVMCCL